MIFQLFLTVTEFPLNDDDDDAEKHVIQIEFPLFKTYWVVKGNKFKKKKKKRSNKTQVRTLVDLLAWCDTAVQT